MDIKKLCGTIADSVITTVSAMCIILIALYVLVDIIGIAVLIFSIIF